MLNNVGDKERPCLPPVLYNIIFVCAKERHYGLLTSPCRPTHRPICVSPYTHTYARTRWTAVSSDHQLDKNSTCRQFRRQTSRACALHCNPLPAPAYVTSTQNMFLVLHNVTKYHWLCNCIVRHPRINEMDWGRDIALFGTRSMLRCLFVLSTYLPENTVV
jgi:hypothetical protein